MQETLFLLSPERFTNLIVHMFLMQMPWCSLLCPCLLSLLVLRENSLNLSAFIHFLAGSSLLSPLSCPFFFFQISYLHNAFPCNAKLFFLLHNHIPPVDHLSVHSPYAPSKAALSINLSPAVTFSFLAKGLQNISEKFSIFTGLHHIFLPFVKFLPSLSSYLYTIARKVFIGKMLSPSEQILMNIHNGCLKVVTRSITDWLHYAPYMA